ncbi:BTB/POZ and MATH domain-containing protein 2-like [Triticum aestivum]|uniref:BTB/POZ and MATH domain-containing protein 2-like n=1 Tax=Triticum aestivum TaxID=4565 RepID=UPI001D035C81|nr:BTB/POZ and MATH domain-containing protein 2-like [Triticum aestivum]
MSPLGFSLFRKGKLSEPEPRPTVPSSGYHLIALDSYSDTKRIPTGESIDSAPFTIGGYRWVFKYYPNGSCKNTSDFISIHAELSLDQKVAQPVKVVLRFSSTLSLSEAVRPTPIGQGERFVFSSGCTVLAFDRLIRRRDFEKEHLNGDLSIIRCDINVAADSSVAAPLLENVPPSDIKEHIARLLSSKEGADVTFEVGGEMLVAHRCILAARSAIFKAELFGPMKEGATANVIRIQDMEAKVFRALLSFIYTDSLPKMDIDSMDEGEVEEQGKGEEAMWLQSLLAAADRYDIRRMKLLCQNKLQ